jgi:hypothetical protein
MKIPNNTFEKIYTNLRSLFLQKEFEFLPGIVGIIHTGSADAFRVVYSLLVLKNLCALVRKKLFLLKHKPLH